MPMNLSQLALTEILNQHNATPQSLFWGSYCPEETDPTSLNEKDAIIELNKYAEKIYKDKKIQARLESDIRGMIVSIPDQKGQREFIKRLGKNGADTIVDILTKKWKIKKISQMNTSILHLGVSLIHPVSVLSNHILRKENLCESFPVYGLRLEYHAT